MRCVLPFLDFPTYFPGTTTLASASTITLAPGSTVRADFALARATEGFTVSGRVFFLKDFVPKSNGAPTVTLQPIGKAPGFRDLGPIVTGPMEIAADGGTFMLSSIPPGDYLVSTNLQVPVFLSVEISVREQDVSGVEFFIPRWADVIGTIVDESGHILPSAQISFTDLDDPNNTFETAFVFRSSEGPPPARTFAVPLLEGTYRIAADPPERQYFKSLTDGSTDLLRSPLKVTGTDSPIYISGVVAWAKPVRISGRVVGSAPPLAVVELVGSLQRRRPIRTFVNADGSFEFSGVMPGSYEVTIGLSSGARATAQVTVAGEDVSGIEIKLPSLHKVKPRVSVEGGNSNNGAMIRE